MPKKHKIHVYALSTCIWCKKTLSFLEKNSLDCSHVFIDELEGEEKAKVMEEMKKHNKFGNFPTVVVDDKDVIVGYDEDKLRKVLGL